MHLTTSTAPGPDAANTRSNLPCSCGQHQICNEALVQGLQEGDNSERQAAEWSEQRPVGLGGKVRQRVSAPVTAPQYTEAFHWDSGRRFLFQFLGKVDYWTLENLQRLNKKYLLLAI